MTHVLLKRPIFGLLTNEPYRCYGVVQGTDYLVIGPNRLMIQACYTTPYIAG
jgi:hypothetical protein